MRTKIFIVIFVLLAQVAVAQITFTNLGVDGFPPDIGTDVNLSSYVGESWTPPTSGLIIVLIAADKAGGSGTPTTPTMSGNSLTWTQIGSTLDCGTRVGLSLFGANASGSTTGATTVDFGGVNQTSVIALFFHAAGVDLSGGVAAAFVQAPTNTGTGTSLTVTLNAAGNSNNRPIAGFWHNVTEATTHRTNWTELDDLSVAAEATGMDSQYRGDAFETTASASWTTSSGCCGIAAEIKAAAVGGASTARVIIINQ